MSPTGPKYPSVATDAGGGTVAWTNVANAKVEDGAVANCGQVGPGGGGGSPNQLNTTGFGFAIPSTAIIDGIKLEIKVSTNDAGGGSCSDTYSSGVYLLYNAGNTVYANTPNKGQFWPSSGLAWLTYGSTTSLWGKTWTPADINNANFGASMSASAGHATSAINVDSVRITVYWHTAPTDVPKRYVYKIYTQTDKYLGNLPDVSSEFAYSHDINTAGSQIEITVAQSADTSLLPAVTTIDDEAGNPIQVEDGTNLTTTGAAPIVGVGTDANKLIKNGNKIVVWEYSYYYPNGRIAFKGEIERWEANYGNNNTEDIIKILAYSNGSDLDNYVVRGSPFTYTLDQSQTSINQYSQLYVNDDKLNTYYKYGQTFTVGAGVTNVAAIAVELNVANPTDVTLRMYADPSLRTLYATSVAPNLTTTQSAEVQFGFAYPVVVVPGTQYFFEVSVGANQQIQIFSTNTNPYSGGQLYSANYGGGSGGGSYYPTSTDDLYFKTFSGTGSTTATYTSTDPSAGMLIPIMNDYISRGGLLQCSAQSSTLSLTYKFNTNTIYEGVQAILSLLPDGFYYYADLGADRLWLLQASTTADILLTKGVHIENLTIVATIENIKNAVLFSGGATAGVNLYKSYNDANSINLYGQRLERKVDNRVTVAATADAIGNSTVAELKDEMFETKLTVVDKTMDITLFKPGLVIGFRGFGNFADSLLAQIVRIDYTPEEVNLTLGIQPKRLNPEFEKITRGLIAEQTIANPTAPS